MIKLAIDLGSWVTKIFMSGFGVVLTEATCAAVEQQDGNNYAIKFLGNKARALSGKSAQNTHIVNPVVDGDIVQEEVACALLAEFLKKLDISPRKARRTEVLFILPCGSKSELKEKYLRLADNCGIGKVRFIQSPFASFLGASGQLSESMPVFTLDIGYGLTNIAALSLDGIISGLSLNLGGGNIDVHLMDLLAENHNLRIGALTAERIKNRIATFVREENRMMSVYGRDVATGNPSSMLITTDDVYEVQTLYLNKILEYVTMVITKLPAEVAPSVMHSGISLSGGLAKMDGICEYVGDSLDIPVNLAKEPDLAAVTGGGVVLSSEFYLERLTTVG